MFTSKLSKLLLMLLHFSDFLHLKITIRTSYEYNQVKVRNLVYFGSPCIDSYNDYSTLSINLQI